MWSSGIYLKEKQYSISLCAGHQHTEQQMALVVQFLLGFLISCVLTQLLLDKSVAVKFNMHAPSVLSVVEC